MQDDAHRDTYLWLLYSDLVSRCNQLIDECAHLQATVYSHLSQQPEIFRGCASDHRTADGERDWLPNVDEIRGHAYYARPPQERALRNLYVTIGAQAHALDQMLVHVEAAYERAVNVDRPSRKRNGIFWFIALRGHLLGSYFPFTLRHLQHAQEKLIQILENMPGLLPGPTLMRRWSSGGYGEFLSEYSRQVNARVQRLHRRMCSDTPEDFEEWRKNRFLVHSWSHEATSLTTLNSVSYRRDGADSPREDEPLTFMTVWSSYFYLEQPALFPLLYHEFSHHYADRQSASAKGGDGGLWFDRATETAALLASISPIDRSNVSFWAEFVNEIWADTISLALCGDGFFAALMLQIIGLEGEDKYFSDYDQNIGSRVPLDLVGSMSRRVLPVPYPASDPAYFWEARAMVASRVYRSLRGQATANTTGLGWVDGLDAFLDAWWDGGTDVMAEHLTSREHQTHWTYRINLNKWVADVIWDGLLDFVTELRKVQSQFPEKQADALSPKVLDLIRKDIEGYMKSLGTACQPSDLPLAPGHDWRLEDLCPRIRWWAGAQIAEQLRVANTDLSPEQFTKWARTYVHHLCCDGSVSFRIAHEWQSSRSHLYTAAAEYLRKVAESQPADVTWASDLAPWEVSFLKELGAAVDRALARRQIYKSQTERILHEADQLAMLATQVPQEDWQELREFIEKHFDDRLLCHLRSFVDGEHGIGSFTLGVLRPSHMAAAGGYGPAIGSVQQHLEKASSTRAHRVNAAGFAIVQPPVQFITLVGEYSFAAFQPGFSCLNKGIHLPDPPPCILKPRDALRVSVCSKPITASTFLRVSQVSFKYRWQWTLLAERLAGNADVFLSSAWEDILLVTYHDHVEDLSDQLEAHKLAMRSWMDIHSNMGLLGAAAVGSPAGTISTTDYTVEGFCRRWAAYGSGTVSARTGRYDAAIDWNTPCPFAVLGALSAIPPQEWTFVESISTSLFRPCVTAGEAGYEAATFRSQVVLRHVGRA